MMKTAERFYTQKVTMLLCGTKEVSFTIVVPASNRAQAYQRSKALLNGRSTVHCGTMFAAKKVRV